MSRIGRFGRVGLAALLVAAALAADRLASPSGTFACSCAARGPEVIGTFGNEPTIIVFVGTVVSMQEDGRFGQPRGELLVQRLFKGTIPSARLPVIGGGGGDCTLPLEAGQRMITAARFVDDVVTPGLCMPYGDPATPDGLRLIDVAVRAYGPGAMPPGAPAELAAPPSATDAGPLDPAVLAVAGALAVTVLLFGWIAVVARRTRAAP